MMESFFIVLLFISTGLTLAMDTYMIQMKKKQQIHFFFICLVSSMLIWNLTVIFQILFPDSRLIIFSEQVYFSSVILVSTSLLYSGIVFAKTRIRFTWKYRILLIIPIISMALVFTNDIHHLFIEKYSLQISEIVYGEYFIVHTLYSYACIFIGLYYFIFFSIKNSGFFSKQSMLISMGFLIPLVFDVLGTFKIINGPVYIENISFSVTIACCMLAVVKYEFLNIMPIALQKVVDLISDSYIVLSNKNDVIDYNRTFADCFGNTFGLKRNRNFFEIFREGGNSKSVAEFKVLIEQARVGEKTVRLEKLFELENNDRFFTVEITPITSQTSFLGTLILLKDITEHKKNIESIKESQAILLEQERLASLGQLIGGIAHNLKTPIMSLAGGIEALKDLAAEYRDSVGDSNVTEQDHKDIAKEMLTWLDKMKPYCGYMSDVISAVKGQAVQMNSSMTEKFTVDELVKRVELLMKHELKKYHCILNIDSQLDMNTEIKGEVNNLVQVFDNIIINAIQAYEGKVGTIDLHIVRSGDNIEFVFKDYAKGIPKKVSDRLFKEMITTKGKNGTGLGLYMSYSTIKGRFGGNMAFTSTEGSGTTFFITVPCISYRDMEVFK